jgi:hypothetical protein
MFIKFIIEALNCTEDHAKLVYEAMDMTDFSEATKEDIMVDAIVANMMLVA